MTLDDLEQPKHTVAEKTFTEPTRKKSNEDDPHYQRQNVSR